MFPTSAAKYGLKAEQQKTKQHEQEVLHMEKQLLQMKTQQSNLHVAKPPKIQNSQAPSFSEQQTGIQISGIGQIVPTKTIKATNYQGTAKSSFNHEMVQQIKYKRQQTPTKKPVQPLNQLSENSAHLYNKALGQLGVIDVNFTSKADSLVQKILEDKNKSIKQPDPQKQENILEEQNITEQESQPILQNNPNENKYQIKYEQDDSNCGFECKNTDQKVDMSSIPTFMTKVDTNQEQVSEQNQDTIQAKYNLFQDDEPKQSNSLAIGGDAPTIEILQPKVQISNNDCQASVDEKTIMEQIQTGLILDQLVKQFQESGKSQDQRRLDLIKQVIAEDDDKDFTIEELLAELDAGKQ